MKLYFYKYTPYIREISVALDYAATKTSLNLFQLFKFEDMQTSLKHAQVNELENQYRNT